jgi:predicted HTH domain antitoxin
VTKHGQPVFVAVPFDEGLVREGVKVALAVKLFEEDVLTLRQAAKVGGMSLAEFLEECAARDIPVVRYGPEELEQEVKVFDELHRR